VKDAALSDRSNEPPPLTPLTPEQIVARLDYEFPELIRRRDELLAGINAFLSVNPTIVDASAQGRAAENRRMFQALSVSAENKRVEAKAPYLAAGKALDAWFKRAIDPLEAPMAKLFARMTDFGLKVEEERRRIAEEAAAAARAEADRAAEEAAKALLLEIDSAQDRLDEAVEAEQTAARAEQHAAAAPAEHSRVRGEFGAVASLTRRWKWREVDHNLIPRDLMDVSSAKVVALITLAGMDAKGVPKAVIPGITIYEVKSV
jgi:hypothetical protein